MQLAQSKFSSCQRQAQSTTVDSCMVDNEMREADAVFA